MEVRDGRRGEVLGPGEGKGGKGWDGDGDGMGNGRSREVRKVRNIGGGWGEKGGVGVGDVVRVG